MGTKSSDIHEYYFDPALDTNEFNDRMLKLHKKAYSSGEFDFDKVMKNVYRAPQGYVTVDPQLVFDGKNWHLFYVTGKIEYADVWIEDIRKGDFEAAKEHPYEEGEGHAVGRSLFDLKYHSSIFTIPQGEFAYGLQGDSAIARYKDRWIDLYTTRGPKGQAMCLAYSTDLYDWVFDPRNPILTAPDYALPTGKCGGAYIVEYSGCYLIYYMLSSRDGMGGVALLSTENFEDFRDHGFVYKAPLQLRGTRTVESPCVVLRNNMWHLFFGLGTGWWHVQSNRPDCFMGDHHFRSVTSIGAYCMGPFHACRVIQTPDGEWYMASTRKEEARRQNRINSVLKFRGSSEDESVMLEGLYLSRLKWDGDFPILTEWE